MESPIQENELPYKAYMKLKKSVLFEFQNGTIINLEKSVVFQQLPRGGAAIFWRQTVFGAVLLSAPVRYPGGIKGGGGHVN